MEKQEASVKTFNDYILRRNSNGRAGPVQRVTSNHRRLPMGAAIQRQASPVRTRGYLYRGVRFGLVAIVYFAAKTIIRVANWTDRFVRGLMS